MTTTTDLRALNARAIEIMESGGYGDFVRLIHRDAHNREAYVDEPPAARVPGPSGFHATAQWLRAAFADLTWKIHDVVVDGDLVVSHVTMSGRHVGPFVAYDQAGEVDEVFPPTGRKFATTQTHWLRFERDQVIEHWANRDDLGTAKQLAWVPPSPVYLMRMAIAKRRARRASAAPTSSRCVAASGVHVGTLTSRPPALDPGAHTWRRSSTPPRRT
jgi:predicted ester cyclase